MEIDDMEAPSGQCDPSSNKKCKPSGGDDTLETGDEINLDDDSDEEEDDSEEADVSEDEDEEEEDDGELSDKEEDKSPPEGPAVIDPEGKEDDDSYTVPTPGKSAVFFDGFADRSLGQWVATSAATYDGSFKVGQGKEPTIPGDRGLIVPEKARKYGLSAVVPKLGDVSDKKVIIQYEVKYEDGQTCGGAYLKMPLVDFDQKKFNGDTPYSVMFGPDKCGGTNKVHFIFQSEHNGKRREHHLSMPPAVPNLGSVPETHLYTLIVDNSDSSFNVMIDGESKANGTIDKGFTPAVAQLKKIDDPEDKKPKDWVDDKKIPDESAVKPDDWDESEPKQITDEKAVMPDDWEVDTPLKIPDTKAKQPDDWDVEEDGEWDAPLVANPKCEEISGCGPWTAPKIDNPKYKGKWTAPLVDNPKYVGPWKARQIDNPDYYEVDKVELLPIGGVALELWTMDQGIVFDNVYVGTNEKEAQTFADKTWGKKQEVEKELAKKKEEELAASRKEQNDKIDEQEGEDEEEDEEDEEDEDEEGMDEGDEAAEGDEKDEL